MHHVMLQITFCFLSRKFLIALWRHRQSQVEKGSGGTRPARCNHVDEEEGENVLEFDRVF